MPQSGIVTKQTSGFVVLSKGSEDTLGVVRQCIK